MGELSAKIAAVNRVLNDFIWGPVMLAVILAVGAMFTVRTGVFQITRIRLWFSKTLLACFQKKDVHTSSDQHSISQFQSLCTTLAATLGIGNITGVATAIVAGGPGAVFWMWVSAFLGMMTVFAENVLGIKYRYRDGNGKWIGGTMIYIERGLHCKWLAVLFAVFCSFAAFGIGNMTQVNSIAGGLEEAFGIQPLYTAIVLMAVTTFVIVGGIKRVAGVTEKVVPFMALFYIAGGLLVIIFHASRLPAAFTMIIKEAFRLRSAGAGALGYGISVAMRMGISRGVFSNEAGLGSSAMVNSASDIREPVVQGMWGILEVFIDSIVVCSITALAILTSGVYDMQVFLRNGQAGIENLNGTKLVSAAFSTVIPFGGQFMGVCIMLFAFATVLGWSCFGEQSVAYLFGERAVFPYQVAYILFILVGCVTSLELVWDVSDTLNGFMAVPNLLAVTLLSGEVVRAVKEYLSRWRL